MKVKCTQDVKDIFQTTVLSLIAALGVALQIYAVEVLLCQNLREWGGIDNNDLKCLPDLILSDYYKLIW